MAFIHSNMKVIDSDEKVMVFIHSDMKVIHPDMKVINPRHESHASVVFGIKLKLASRKADKHEGRFYPGSGTKLQGSSLACFTNDLFLLRDETDWLMQFCKSCKQTISDQFVYLLVVVNGCKWFLVLF